MEETLRSLIVVIYMLTEAFPIKLAMQVCLGILYLITGGTIDTPISGSHYDLEATEWS